MPNRDPEGGARYWSRARVHGIALLAITLGGVYLCTLLWAPFLSTFTWALTLAILFAPAYKVIETKLRNSNLAALVSVMIVALIIVAPTFFVAERLLSEAVRNVDVLQRQITTANLQQIVDKHPWLSTFSHLLSVEIDFRSVVGNFASWVTNVGANFVKKTTVELVSVLITFYALFFLLRDRREAINAVTRISPLKDTETNYITERISDTVHAIVYGTVVVSAIQGALGGLMFWWLSLPAPFLWGLVMGLLSIVPILGAFIVWVPTTFMLALDGDWGKALLLASWGGLVVGTIDNFLRPILMGERLNTHTFTTFISLIGGLTLFGGPGVILGPVIVTATIALLDLLRSRNNELLIPRATQQKQSMGMIWHCSSSDDVLAHLGVSHKGLTAAKAQELLNSYGQNVLHAETRIRPWTIFWSQFDSILIWVLIIAAVLAGYVGDAIDAGIILAIVGLNAIVGFYQEYSAEKSIATLMRMTAPRAKVWRDAALVTISSSEVVPGDILELEAGDLVAADARLLQAASLTCIEAALTGESEAVDKSAERINVTDIPIGDRKNMVFMGTSVATGSAKAVVVATAMNTQFGSIASLLVEASEIARTPLEQRLEAFGRILLWVTLVIVSILFGLGMWRGGDHFELFLTSISLAVAAIPESLPAVVTAALAIGVKRMTKRRALIRRLASVETLGATNVICTDKTGTLTVGQMTVRTLFVAGRVYEVTGEGYNSDGEIRHSDKTVDPAVDEPLMLMGKILVGCNNASLEKATDGYRVIGDPTEAALLIAGQKAGSKKPEVDLDQPIHLEFPFDSNRKMHTVVRRGLNGALRALINGAPEILLERCNYILSDTGIRRITPSDRAIITQLCTDFAKRSLRVLGSALRDLETLSSDCLKAEFVENDLVFVGLSGLYDPPRPEAREAITKCQNAGVRVIMITGDHPHTAETIGSELGIGSGGSLLSGVDLDGMTDADLARVAPTTAIYARVSAEHKLRIVKAWQANNAVVAMTGDGVNDAPAIKAADIGIAMGRTGTEVTKQASDMIITDDHFATIVSAIEEGRGIYENIRKTILYLLASNSSELLLMTICILVGLPAPLLPIHLLWINLITDGPPALCLATDRADVSVMRKGPRARDKEITDQEFIWTMLPIAVFISGISFIVYAYSIQHKTQETAQTCVFITLIFGQLLAALNLRSSTPIWRQSPSQFGSLLIVIIGSVCIQILMQHNTFLANMLHISRVSLNDEIALLAVAMVPFLTFELLKSIQHGLRHKTERDEPATNQVDPIEIINATENIPDRELNLMRGSTVGMVIIILGIGVWLNVTWHNAPINQNISNTESHKATNHILTAHGFVSKRSFTQIQSPLPGKIKSMYCKIGDEVQSGQLCASLDAAPHEIEIEQIRTELERLKKLHTSAEQKLAVTAQKLHNTNKARHLAKSNHAAGLAKDKYDRALAEIDHLNKLRVEQESRLKIATSNIARLNIYSPINGVIVAQHINAGDTFEKNDEVHQIFSIALANAEIVSSVNSKNAKKLHVGDEVNINAEMFSGNELKGKITAILPSSTREEDYDVIINMPNPAGLLKEKMTFTVRYRANP